MVMNRLHYWLHAKTQYDIHSPFVFEMYRDVLFARIDDATRRRHGIPRGDRFREVVYKCCDHYRLTVSDRQAGGIAQLTSPDTPLAIQVIDRPHATPAAEQEWQRLKSTPGYPVSIDLYDVSLLIHNPHLHPQAFLLR